MEIRGLSALVTGASGFIGGRLAERLATEEGMRVRGMVRNVTKAERLRELSIEIVKGDLLDLSSLSEAVDGCDIVFHCASPVRMNKERNEFYRTFDKGTENIIEVSSHQPVKKFIHFSSVAVYGMDLPKYVDETAPFLPCRSDYCNIKRSAEKVVWAAHHEAGLPVVVIRPGNVYGPHSNTWTIRPIKQISSGQMILINGGTGLCNYVYIDNLLDATLVAAKYDRAIGQVYQITDGIPVPWKEFYGYYARMIGKPINRSIPGWMGKLIALGTEKTLRLIGKSPRLTREAIGFLSWQTHFSIEKARRELGYRPRFSLETGMKLTEQWLREEGYLPRV